MHSRKKTDHLYLFLTFVQPNNGSDILIFYSLDVFRRAKVKLNNHVLAIMTQSAIAFGSFLAALGMKRVPRRVQFISSTLLMSLSMFAIGSLLHQMATNPEGVQG